MNVQIVLGTLSMADRHRPIQRGGMIKSVLAAVLLASAITQATTAAPSSAAPSSAATPKEKVIWLAGGRRAFGLYLSAPDGTGERPFLPDLRPSYNPSFSTHGEWIVFTSERFGSADVFRVHPDGSGLERLTDSQAFDDQGALAPDGRTLAFVSTREGGTANIWLMDIASRRVRNLTRNGAGNFRPSWSPDGKWIAFSSDRDTRHVRYIRGTYPAWELMQTTATYIVHPDGNGLRRLTPLDGCAGSPRWSRDGRRVIFAEVVDVEAMRHFETRTRIVSLNVKTGERKVYSNGTEYAWSPGYVTDTEIGYGINDPTDPAGASLLYTSGRQGPVGSLNPSWSPDGSLMVYDKDEDAPGKFTWMNGWVEVSSSRDPRYELIRGSAFVQDMVSFTRTGEQFLYRPSNSRSPLLKLAHWDGSGSTIIDGSADGRQIGEVALSGDGRTVAFGIWDSRHPGETGQIAAIDSDGSRFRVITHDEGHDDYPSFSSDGTKVVYRLGKYEERQHTERGLRIVSLADGKIVKLTSGWDNFPAWSPRGDRIVFTGFETGDYEIYTVRPDGTGLRQLTHTHGNDAHAVWSPDGKWIAFVSSRKGWKDEVLRPYHWSQSFGEIFVMRADGTDVRQLTDDQWEDGVIGWAPSAAESAAAAPTQF